jgi:hypothetical protein
MNSEFVISVFVFTIMGLYFIFRKNTHRHQITANVDNADCSYRFTSNSLHYTCNLVITYVYNNTTFSNKPLVTGSSYKAGNSINIYIDPTNPSDYVEDASSYDYVIGSVLLLPFFTILIIMLYNFIKKS